MRNYPLELRRDSDTMTWLDPTHLLLAFKQPQTFENLSPALLRLGLGFEVGDRDENGVLPPGSVNHTDRRFWIRTTRGEAFDERLYDSIEQAFGEQLDWIGPVYRMADTPGLAGLFCPLPNVLLIKTKQDDPAAISRMASENDLKEDSKKSEYLIGYRYFVIDNPKDNASYQRRRQLLESGSQVVDEVRLENMPMLIPFAMIPNDELYGFQWSMFRIQAGATTPNPLPVTGWDLQSGNPNITICVIDSGCDLGHPDLKFSDPGIRLPLTIASGFLTGAPNPTVQTFFVGHGTACAGIAAATINNQIGVAGVAPNCRILPIAFSDATDFEVAQGISYAIGKARVINMSFSSNVWDESVINPAIEVAHNNNIIMCAITGNGGIDAIGYPASHPHVIACGASGVDDAKLVFSSFGAGVSVVAPGVDIATTDMQGNDGFNPGSDYAFITGTSAAAPHVAGLAALLLSADPTLSSNEVTDIIERTADKVGPDPYTAHPFDPSKPSWNPFMGHGRINVLRALQELP